MRKYIRMCVCAGMVCSLFGCTLHPAYTPPHTEFSSLSAASARGETLPAAWWTALHDPAIDKLAALSYDSNPTLSEALGRVDEARAEVGIARSEIFPTIHGNATTVKSDDGAGRSTTTGIEAGFSWELDLFGRIKNSNMAAHSRLDARTADAENIRLMMASRSTETVITLRACRFDAMRLGKEIMSREQSLILFNLKLDAGFVSIPEQTAMIRDLENTKVARASQIEACAHLLNALVAFSGDSRDKINDVLEISKGDGKKVGMPTPPQASPGISADVIIQHHVVKQLTWMQWQRGVKSV